MPRRQLPVITDKRAREVLRRLCKEHGITLELLGQLIEIQRENLGRGKQIGISSDFSAAIAEFLEEREGVQ